MDPSVGHLNGILARVGGNLNNNFQKSQMPGWLPGGGMLKLRFDRYIIAGPFPSLPNLLSLFVSIPFSFRRQPGKANQSEVARVHGRDCAGLRRA